MIKLHRINEKEIVINAEMIMTVEAIPDTVISLYDGNKFVVKESIDEVTRKVIEYKGQIQVEAGLCREVGSPKK